MLRYLPRLIVRASVLTISRPRMLDGYAMVRALHYSVVVNVPHDFSIADYILTDISVKYLGSDDKSKLPSILQFSSEDKCTKYEICQRFGEIMGLSIAGIEPNTEGNDPNASVQRPYDCHLSTKALKDLGIDVSTQDFTGWWRWNVKAFRK